MQNYLYRSTSIESRIRNATKEAVQEIQNAEIVCSCSRQIISRSCRNCFIIEVSRRLQNSGYNSAICKTKWRSSPSNIPSGKQLYCIIKIINKKTLSVPYSRISQRQYTFIPTNVPFDSFSLFDIRNTFSYFMF